MKIQAFLLTAITAPLIASTAHAQQVENFNFSSAYAMVKCTTTTDSSGNTSMSCDEEPGSMNTPNNTVALTDCQSDGNGGNFCSGRWTAAITVENQSYSAAISIVHAVAGDQTSSYAIAALVADQSPLLELNLAGATITDGATLVGQSIKSKTDATVTYTPVVILAKANSSQPQALLSQRVRSLQLHH